MKCIACGCEELSPVNTNYIYSETSFKQIFGKLKCVKCKNCYLVQVNMGDNINRFEEKLDQYYVNQYRTDKKNVLSEQSISWYENRARAITKVIAQKYHIDENIKVFELGAGYGINLNYLKEIYKNATVYTYEKNKTVIDSLDRFGIKNVNLQEIEDRSLDYVIMAHVLEHLTNPAEEILCCINKLKPSGMLYIEVPNNPSYSSRFFEPHISFWSEESLNNLFENKLSSTCNLIGIYTTGATLPKSRINSSCYIILKKLFGRAKWYRKMERDEKKRVSVSDESRSLDFSVPTQNGIFLKMILEKKDE